MPGYPRHGSLLLSFLLLATSTLVWIAADNTAKAQQTKTISVVLTQYPSGPGTATGIQFTAGQPINITASGTLNWYTGECGGACISTPDGIACTTTDFYANYFGESLPCWSLVGQIGNNPPFFVGTNLANFAATQSGELYLGVNDNNYPDNTGSWIAVISFNSPDLLSITTPSLPSTISGDQYPRDSANASDTSPFFQFTSTGGQGTVTWSTDSTLPEGFTLSTDGILSNGTYPAPLATPGTYSITITATDSQVSISKTFSLVVISEDCSQNAYVDLSKPLFGLSVSTDGDITSYTARDYLRTDLFLVPGLNYGTTNKPGGYGTLPLFNGINIHVYGGAIVYPTDGIQLSQISTVFAQTWTIWDGYSVYQGFDGARYDEWTAQPLASPINDVPSSTPHFGIDYAEPQASNAIANFADSPSVHAPVNDSKERELVGMYYHKTFTIYLGCHTHRDVDHFTLDQAQYYIRTIGTLNWGVNYTGTVVHALFGAPIFIPDEGAGVVVGTFTNGHLEPPVVNTTPLNPNKYNPF